MNNLKITNCLLSCLKPFHKEQKKQLLELDPIEWERIVSLAIQQKVESWLYKRLKEHKILEKTPPLELERLRLSCHKGAARNLQIYSELTQITKKFNQFDIHVIVLKGAYLAHTVYPSPSLRRMVDCDILVRDEDLPKAVEVLTNLGYKSSSPIEKWNKSLSHHLPPFRKENSKSEVELHWTIFSTSHPREIDITDLWKRAQSYPLKGGEALTLCPEDMLLHICYHASYHHLFLQGYRSLLDVAFLLAHFDTKRISNDLNNKVEMERVIDWQTVCERSRLWGCAKGTYLLLYLAKTLLNVDIPTYVLETLKPDTLSNDVIETAKTCLFLPEEYEGSEDFFVAETMKNLPIHKKIQFASKRLFLSRQELVNKYKIAENSLWIYCYYPLRLWEGFSKITQHTWNYLFKMNTLKYEINKRNQISGWLKGTH